MSLETFLDKIWINKVPITIAYFNILSAAIKTSDYCQKYSQSLQHRAEDFDIIGMQIALLPFALTALLVVASMRNRNYDKIVSAIKTEGIQGKCVRDSITSPFDRGIAKRALQRTGHGEEYERLKQMYIEF